MMELKTTRTTMMTTMVLKTVKMMTTIMMGSRIAKMTTMTMTE